MGAADDSSVSLPPEPIGGRCGLADGCKPRAVRTGRAQRVPLVLSLRNALSGMKELLNLGENESGLLLYLLHGVFVS